jgi:cysteine desulfurase
MMKVINLDHISAKPLLPEVKEVMIAAIEKDYHNPSSQHKSGEDAAEALQTARAAMAGLLNCKTPKEIVFTSGGTESVNHAIKGVAMANEDKGKHIVTSNIEHNAVIRSLRRLKSNGFAVTSLPVDTSGRVNPKDVAEAITKDTILVSIMQSNNETGTAAGCRFAQFCGQHLLWTCRCRGIVYSPRDPDFSPAGWGRSREQQARRR